MMDHVFSTSRIPNEGETVIGTDFLRNPGGKGINQAISAARLGADVIMFGKLGDDSNGHEFKEELEREGIHHEGVLIDQNYTTGVGGIYKELNSNNRIIVVPGANRHYTFDEFNEAFSTIGSVDYAILQLEMDLEVTWEIIKILKKNKIKTILNPAPAAEIPLEVLDGLDYITPNEHELSLITNVSTSTIDEVKYAATILLDKGVKNVVVTLGDNGAYVMNHELSKHVPGIKVNAIDTVAAGDSFNGALAVALGEGKTLEQACQIANKVGSITVTRVGAISSLPYREEVII